MQLDGFLLSFTVGGRRWVQLNNRVQYQREEIFFQCVVDAGQPMCFLATAGQVQIVTGADVYTIAPAFLGEIAGVIGGGKNIGNALGRARNGHQSDTDANVETRAVPYEAKSTNGFSQVFGQAFRLYEIAMLDDDTELVTSKPGERIALTHLIAQHRTHLLQKVIACCVTAGIVDDFELIEIQIAKRVFAIAAARRVQHAMQTLFKLAPVDQSGQIIVTCLVGQLARHAMRPGDVAAGAAVTLESAVLVEYGLSADGVHARLTVGADNCEVQILELTVFLQLLDVHFARRVSGANGLQPLGVSEAQQMLGGIAGNVVVALGEVAEP